MSSRLARDDCEDLSARSGGSGPLGAPMLLLLFSSQVWEGWLRLGMPSPLTGTESDDGVSANQTKHHKEYWLLHKQVCLDFVVFVVIGHDVRSFIQVLVLTEITELEKPRQIVA